MSTSPQKHVVVLMGGWSAERDVSLVSGAACAKALRANGYDVTELDVDRDVAQRLTELKPDVVFNGLHGRWGEDGAVQGVLEVLGIPYTHSGVMASAVAMHKPTAKKIFRDAGISTPEEAVVSRDELFRGDPLPRPFVVKPINEGSSVGVRILMPNDALRPEDEGPWQNNELLLVERYIPGRELAVAVRGDTPLGVIELRPTRGFYDYDAKYTDGLTEHFMPAPVPPAIYEKAMIDAARAHQLLGCRGVTRSDFRYDDTAAGDGKLYLLEVNTQPGMTPLSLVPEVAAHTGMDFNALVRWMVEDASCPR